MCGRPISEFRQFLLVERVIQSGVYVSPCFKWYFILINFYCIIAITMSEESENEPEDVPGVEDNTSVHGMERERAKWYVPLNSTRVTSWPAT